MSSSTRPRPSTCISSPTAWATGRFNRTQRDVASSPERRRRPDRLAAPDIDAANSRTSPRHRAGRRHNHALCLVSDRALLASRKANGAVRAGDIRPRRRAAAIVAGIDSIDVSALSTTFRAESQHLCCVRRAPERHERPDAQADTAARPPRQALPCARNVSAHSGLPASGAVTNPRP